MNLVEKKKIEGIVISKINKGKMEKADVNAIRESKLRKSLEKNPPREIISLKNKILKSKKDTERFENLLDKKGWDLDYKDNLSTSSNPAIDKLTEKGNKELEAFEQLKESFTLKIYYAQPSKNSSKTTINEQIWRQLAPLCTTKQITGTETCFFYICRHPPRIPTP